VSKVFLGFDNRRHQKCSFTKTRAISQDILPIFQTNFYFQKIKSASMNQP